MALLTGDSLKLLQNRIDDAKTSLKNQLAQYEKALAEHSKTKDRTKLFDEDFNKAVENFKEKGAVEVVPFLELLENLTKKERERSSIPFNFLEDEIIEARGYEFVLEATIPFHYTEEQEKELKRDYSENGLAAKHADIRADHDKALKQHNEKALDEAEEIRSGIEDLYTTTQETKMKDMEAAEADLVKARDEYKKLQSEVEKLDEEITDLTKSISELDQGIAEDTDRIAKLETEKSNEEDEEVKDKLQAEIDDLTKAKEAREDKRKAETENKNTKAAEKAVKDSELEAANTALLSAEKSLEEAVESRKRLADVGEFIDNTKDEIRDIYDDHTKSSNELSISEMTYEYTLDPLTKYVEKGENSDLIKQFEEEQEVRREIAKEIKDNSRIKPLIAHRNTGVEQEMKDFDSDTQIIIKEIKEELEIDSEVEQRINSDIESLFERYDNEKDKDLADVNFSKDDAISLTRQSLYDLAISGVIKKIKQACYKGDTSIKLSEDEVSATHLIALHKAGYKVTHESVRRPGRGKADTIFVIDWGFVQEH